MSVEVIGMYAAGTGGTENAAATIDVPQDGFLLGCDWDVHCDFDLDNETLVVELSFIATNQANSNDVRGRLSSVGGTGVVLTSVGINSVSIEKYVDFKEIRVAGGERLYLHIVAGSGVLTFARCNLHFEMGTVLRRSARRR